jgi:O-antigen/teichoic acid export membrane protein
MSHGAGSVRRAIGWLGGGVFAAAALQYLLFFAVARYLGVGDYGAFSLALAVSILLAPLCDLGTSVALVCNGAREPESLQRHFGAALMLRLVMFFPALAIGYTLGSLAGYGDGFATLLLPLLVAAVADGIGNLAAAACQARERMATSAMLQVARSLLRGAAMLGTLAAAGDVHALAVAFAAASAAGAAVAVWVACDGAALPLARAHLLPTLRSALPFGMVTLATILHANADVALLGLYADDQEVGRYHAAARFLLLLQMLPQAVAVATAPLEFRVGAFGVEPSTPIYRVKVTALTLLGLLGAIGLAGHADQLVHSLLGPGFAGSETLLLLLAPVVFLKFLASALESTLSALSHQRRFVVACWLTLVVNLGTGMLLMPQLGALGAALAALLSALFYVLFLAFSLASVGLQLDWRHLLFHPLCIAAATGAFTLVAGPRTALPVALLALGWVLWQRPSDEERQLLRQCLPARRG